MNVPLPGGSGIIGAVVRPIVRAEERAGRR